MKIFDVPQREDAWHELRAGCLVTASDAGQWLIGNTKRDITSRRKRILRYLQNDAYSGGDDRLREIVAKEKKALDYNLPVQRGNHFEDDAAKDFEKFTGLETETVGIAMTDDLLFGASCDRMIVGEESFAEFKVPLPETHLAYLLENQESGGMIEEYQWQVNFTMSVTGFRKGWFFSYPVPYYKAGRLVQEPRLCIPLRWSPVCDQIVRAMDEMKRDLASIRHTLAGIAARQSKGEITAIAEVKF